MVTIKEWTLNEKTGDHFRYKESKDNKRLIAVRQRYLDDGYKLSPVSYNDCDAVLYKPITWIETKWVTLTKGS